MEHILTLLTCYARKVVKYMILLRPIVYKIAVMEQFLYLKQLGYVAYMIEIPNVMVMYL